MISKTKTVNQLKNRADLNKLSFEDGYIKVHTLTEAFTGSEIEFYDKDDVAVLYTIIKDINPKDSSIHTFEEQPLFIPYSCIRKIEVTDLPEETSKDANTN